jgi:copper homeostasis protein CutC
MKVLKYIALSMLLFGCKTKTVTLDKERENELSEMKMHFDSTFNLSLKHQLDLQKNQIDFNSNLVLTSASVRDSSGNRIPFHYKHFVDGNLKEEIFLEGGEINAKTETKETKIDEKKQESKVEKGRIDVDVGQKKEVEKSKVKKAKKAKTKGFQFGFYVWLFLIVVVIIILAWIGKKFKLPDKFKSIFNTNGG